MEICDEIWSQDGKYAWLESIQRCWRKADILPVSWMADINNEVRSVSLPESAKKIDGEDCTALCNLMGKLFVVSKDHAECSAPALDGSYVHETALPDNDIAMMMEEWINVEDDPDFQEAEIEEAIE
jgi:hypothetical protein